MRSVHTLLVDRIGGLKEIVRAAPKCLVGAAVQKPRGHNIVRSRAIFAMLICIALEGSSADGHVSYYCREGLVLFVHHARKALYRARGHSCACRHATYYAAVKLQLRFGPKKTHNFLQKWAARCFPSSMPCSNSLKGRLDSHHSLDSALRLGGKEAQRY